MSIVPFCSSGIRFADDTVWYWMSSFGIPSCFWMSARARWHRSMWKPTYFPLPTVYDRVPDDSRTPIVTVPVALIF